MSQAKGRNKPKEENHDPEAEQKKEIEKRGKKAELIWPYGLYFFLKKMYTCRQTPTLAKSSLSTPCGNPN